MKKDKVLTEKSAKSRCYRCGGLGHFAITNGQKCLTSFKIDRDILDKITYPHISNERAPKNLTVNEVSDESNDDDDHDDDNVDLIDDDNTNGFGPVIYADTCGPLNADLDSNDNSLMHEF